MRRNDTRSRTWPIKAAVLLTLAALLSPTASRAQVVGGPDAAGPSAGGHQGRHGGGGRERPAPAAEPTLEPLRARPDPRQRLDVGALLCSTEADLQQHQAAVVAALDGKEAADTVNCRFVKAMTAAAVVQRHGPARTQVRLPGPPEQLGWTDAVLPGDAPSARP